MSSSERRTAETIREEIRTQRERLDSEVAAFREDALRRGRMAALAVALLWILFVLRRLRRRRRRWDD